MIRNVKDIKENHRRIKTYDEKFYKGLHYKKISKESVERAFNNLSLSARLVYMYFRFLKSTEEFDWELTAVDTCRFCNISERSYHSAIKEMIDKGYLLPVDKKKKKLIFIPFCKNCSKSSANFATQIDKYIDEESLHSSSSSLPSDSHQENSIPFHFPSESERTYTDDEYKSIYTARKQGLITKEQYDEYTASRPQ